MLAGRNLLTCTVCRTQQPGTATVVGQLDGAPCMLVRCPGRLRREPRPDNYYRRLYASTDMRRIVAREHTGLVDDATRLRYESEFKQSTSDPNAPNVLVATPTLEMGIDIGDLSAVLLASLPKTVASYLQRVGRAGRLTGSALNLAFITGRGEQLPRLENPLSVINGQVRAPATYLSAEEILRRQYVAHLVDCFAREEDRPHPRRARGALGSAEPGSFLGELIRFAEDGAERPPGPVPRQLRRPGRVVRREPARLGDPRRRRAGHAAGSPRTCTTRPALGGGRRGARPPAGRDPAGPAGAGADRGEPGGQRRRQAGPALRPRGPDDDVERVCSACRASTGSRSWRSSGSCPTTRCSTTWSRSTWR